jgi:hypothetical protein
MPFEVKAFNFDDVRIDLNDTYTVITPHNGHDNIDPFDISRLFNDRLEFNAIWWNTKTTGPYPIVIQIGDQLFSVTIPTLESGDLRSRQVKYFEITWDQDTRAPGLLILRNGVTVYDDGDFNNGFTRQMYTKRYFLPLPDVLPQVVNLNPDISIDWLSKSFVDKLGNVIDRYQVNSSQFRIASLTDYQLLDDNKVMRLQPGHSIQTVNGIPDVLMDYQGDFSLVYHGGTLATGGISFLLNMAPVFGSLSGWVIKINSRLFETLVGRISGNALSIYMNTPIPLPFSDLHTISFTYEENYTATDSRLMVYWDGLLINSLVNPYSPIRWNTGSQLYLGRFVNQEVNGVSYVGGFKVFKRLLTPEEMLEQHVSQPSSLPEFEADKIASTPLLVFVKPPR